MLAHLWHGLPCHPSCLLMHVDDAFFSSFLSALNSVSVVCLLAACLLITTGIALPLTQSVLALQVGQRQGDSHTYCQIHSLEPVLAECSMLCLLMFPSCHVMNEHLAPYATPISTKCCICTPALQQIES